MGASAFRDGVRLWDDLLAALARLPASERMGCPASVLVACLDHARDSWFGAGLRWTVPLSRRKGGSSTGPNPTNRGKAGTKRHTVADARGTPLGVNLSGANRHDSMVLAATLDAIPPVRSGQGRPRQRSGKLYQTRATTIAAAVTRAIGAAFSPASHAGRDSRQRVGRHRWVAERTHAWMARLRRLVVCYRRRGIASSPSLPSAAPSYAETRPDRSVGRSKLKRSWPYTDLLTPDFARTL